MRNKAGHSSFVCRGFDTHSVRYQVGSPARSREAVCLTRCSVSAFWVCLILLFWAAIRFFSRLITFFVSSEEPCEEHRTNNQPSVYREHHGTNSIQSQEHHGTNSIQSRTKNTMEQTAFSLKNTMEPTAFSLEPRTPWNQQYSVSRTPRNQQHSV